MVMVKDKDIDPKEAAPGAAAGGDDKGKEKGKDKGKGKEKPAKGKEKPAKAYEKKGAEKKAAEKGGVREGKGPAKGELRDVLKDLDWATIGGLAIVTLMVIGSYLLEGGKIHMILQATAMLLVIGGTLGASITGSTMEDLRELIRLLRITVITSSINFHDIISLLVESSRIVRRSGFLALERQMDHVYNPFIRKGMQHLIDGTNPQLLREILEIDMDNALVRSKNAVNIMKKMAGFSPTFGIIGTVLALIYTLSGFSDLEQIASNIALAFVATFWGILMANIFYLPLANKLEHRFQESQLLKEVVMDGILSIQAGIHPFTLAEKLESYLPMKDRVLSNLEKAGPPQKE
jgi:chemotaxis protein MotA